MKMLTNKLIESPEILPTTNAPYKIWTGDTLELLDQIPDCSVDSIVTDPPYGLGKDQTPCNCSRTGLSLAFIPPEMAKVS